MTTTINNNERVFQIVRQGFFSRTYFCNLADIPSIIRTELEPHDEFKIFECWNQKFKVCSKKHLNEMFAAHKMNFRLR